MISVILSTNNEMKHGWQDKILQSLLHQDVPLEIIIIDNGSTDGTYEFWQPYAKCFSLPHSNRAQRLNLGIQNAKYDTIILHHPVSYIPYNSLGNIPYVLKTRIWGGFRHSFDTRHWLLNFTSWYSNIIRAKRGVLYLDHCIFFSRKNLKQEDIYIPEVDIFEDTLFSYQLRKYGKPALLDTSIVTSARRFTRRGIWKQSLLNQYLKLCFLFGKSHKKMNKTYEEKEGYNVRYY